MPKRRVFRVSHSGSLKAIRDNPALPALIQSLSPQSLAQLCARIGVSDAAEFMALAPAEKLLKALDASVWKTLRPGVPEIFDRNELIEWLTVWLDIGEAFTAERLAAMPDEDLTLCLSHVVRLSTGAMWGFERSTEIEDLDRIYAPSYHETGFGPYFVTAAVEEHWETVRAALEAMWNHDPERLLHLFAQLSGDESMLQPQWNRQNSNRDFSSARESDRERRGHVSGTGARAFLAVARWTPLEELLAVTEYDLETRRHLSILARAAGSPEVVPSSGGGTDEAVPLTEPDEGAAGGAGTAVDSAQLDALRNELEAAGLVDKPATTRLLTHDSPTRRPPLVSRLAQLTQDNPEAFDTRSRELAYLASVLMGGVGVNNEAMSTEDARDAALATCNLGFELAQKRGDDSHLESPEPGLVRLFLVGWRALADLPQLVVEAFTRSFEKLATEAASPAQEWLVAEARIALEDLRSAVTRRDLAAAREAALVMSFFFEPRTCRAVVPLLDEIPRVVTSRLGGERGGSGRWIEALADLRGVRELLGTIVDGESR
jgi:hypothetical protein